MLLLAIVTFVLSVYTVAAAPGPQVGYIGVTGKMPGNPPTVAATITQPTNGQRFTDTPITVKGTCVENTLVEIFKSDIFAGSTTCQGGFYSLDIDLLIGENTLIARLYDDLGQPGPDSNAVIVFYDALPSQGGPVGSLDFGSAQMLILTDAVFRGAFPKKDLTVPIEILGGRPPYAITIQWGDGTNKLVARNDNVTFNVTHAYPKPGTYQISLQGADSEGRVAYITTAAIVNGQPPVAAGSTGTTAVPNELLALWPLLIATIAVVTSFWLGERREKRVLDKHGLLLHPS